MLHLIGLIEQPETNLQIPTEVLHAIYDLHTEVMPNASLPSFGRGRVYLRQLPRSVRPGAQMTNPEF
jgi:hypothetical protein